MKTLRHTIKKSVYHKKWYKWFSIILLLILLICFFVKKCACDSKQKNNSNSSQVYYNFPTEPNRLKPVDPNKIEIILDDPLGRSAVNDLINVYFHDTVNLKKFSIDFQKKFEFDTIVPTYYAEQYKRIQFQVNNSKKDFYLNELKKDTFKVKFATKEWIFKNNNINKNDPGFLDHQKKWFYETIGLLEVWDNYTIGSSSVKIAVLDDGFDLNHPELKNRFTNPWNVVTYNKNVYANTNFNFHGTHVAGTIVGEINNGFGISGVAPGCKFMPIQISDSNGFITISSILDGLFYALKNQANVINLSLGFSFGDMAKSIPINEQNDIVKNQLKDEEALWDEVFSIAKNEGVIIVQAAGNDSVLAGLDPMKRSSNSIVVGAFDDNFKLTSFTNHGESVTTYAPGKQIYSSLPNNKMGFLDGTSMSCPIVTGSVALIISYNPNITVQEILDLIKKNSNNGNINFFRLNLIFKEIT